MKEILINPIGKICIQGEEVFIKLDKKVCTCIK